MNAKCEYGKLNQHVAMAIMWIKELTLDTPSSASLVSG